MPTRSVDAQQGAVEDHERLPPGDLDRGVQGRGHRGEHVKSFADIAEHRRDTDSEPAREIRVGLAFAQVGQHQQRLLTCVEASPAGAACSTFAP